MPDTTLRRHLLTASETLATREDLCDLLTALDRTTVWRSLFRGIAHELSNTSQLFTLNNPAFLTDQEIATEWSSTVEWATDKMTAATAVLRDFARTQEMSESPVLVGDLIATIEDWQRYQKGQPPVPVRVDTARGLPPVRASETYLKQVLLALVANAKEAIGDSDGAGITIRTGASSGMVHITVEDSGPGIGAYLHEKIFEPFFTTKNRSEHLGLGATVSRHLAESWGGSLSVHPAPEAGACVVVELQEWGKEVP
jgi:C4-dicarboxylate-specific signal transduction histidine kinase